MLQACDIRRWHLHAVNARTNHVHAVVTAGIPPDKVMDQLKAWCTRRLNEYDTARGAARREHWWTRHGSTRYINDVEYLQNAVQYVMERQ